MAGTRLAMALTLAIASSAAAGTRGTTPLPFRSQEAVVALITENDQPMVRLFSSEHFVGILSREGSSEALQNFSLYRFRPDRQDKQGVTVNLCERKVLSIVTDYPSFDKRITKSGILKGPTAEFCEVTITDRRPESTHKVRVFAAGFLRGDVYVFEAAFRTEPKPSELEEFRYFVLQLK